MDIAKISSKGQITIPADVRKALRLKPGSKVVIVEENGRYYLENQDNLALSAFEEIEEAMKGHAEKAGFENEEDLLAYLEEVKKKLRDKRAKEKDSEK